MYGDTYIESTYEKDSSQISAISSLLLKCQENRPHKITFITSGLEDSWKKKLK